MIAEPRAGLALERTAPWPSCCGKCTKQTASHFTARACMEMPPRSTNIGDDLR
eukprot:CAMPEP_0179022490 /NCGR_PEP_ID=MMETSP0796-20121207/6438_1 /TAXON_ID=73915 /ORGANISM="Pyrodinium bahamense, Strain pbaha01" /LENGTH=52 /DNA_ID=CAMNT_0020718365 /DNA_START=34 /DNA_END=188 /DNA_ORIENTATION=+